MNDQQLTTNNLADLYCSTLIKLDQVEQSYNLLINIAKKPMIDHILSNYQWYRKLKGGRWEQWYIGYHVYETLWLNTEENDCALGCTCTRLSVEDYRPKYNSKHPYR